MLQTRFQCPERLVPRGLRTARGFLQVAVPLALGSAFARALSPQSPSAPGRQPLTVPPAPHKPPSPTSAGPVPQSPGRDAVSASERTQGISRRALPSPPQCPGQLREGPVPRQCPMTPGPPRPSPPVPRRVAFGGLSPQCPQCSSARKRSGDCGALEHCYADAACVYFTHCHTVLETS